MNRIELIINVNEYKSNLKKIAKMLPSDCQLMAIVKANAYGHGAIDIAKAAIEEGVKYLGVACLKEFHELKNAGISYPTLLLAEPLEGQWKELPEELTYTVYTSEFIEALTLKQKKFKIHLKLDTGMNRLGSKIEEADELLSQIKNHPLLELEGIYTHLAQSELPNSGFTERQLEEFRAILGNWDHQGLIHTANSGAIRYFPESMFSMVRLGMDSFENVMEVRSTIILIKHIKAGESVGYDAAFTALEDTEIATISAGYADGITTRFRNGYVQINQRNYPVIGKICMDMFMINLGENPDQIKKGDQATLLGNSGLSMHEFSVITGLNPREITCNIGNGRRYQRVVIK